MHRWILVLGSFAAVLIQGPIATACSPAPGRAGLVFPAADSPVAVGTSPTLVWVGGFSMCTEPPCDGYDAVALFPGDLSGASEPGVDAIALERADWSAGLFATLSRLIPADGPLEAGTYTLWVDYGEFSPWDDERHVLTVDDDRAAPGVAPPAGLVWYDEQLTGTAMGDTCTGSFDHRVFVTIAVDESVTAEDVVWYELHLEDVEGDDLVRVVVPDHLYGESDFDATIETGPLLPPSGMNVDCVAVEAVHLEGARSQPVRLCTPTKCITRSPDDVFDPVDWGSLPACEDDAGDGDEAADTGFPDTGDDVGLPSDAGADVGSPDDVGVPDAVESDADHLDVGTPDATADVEPDGSDAVPSDGSSGLDRGTGVPEPSEEETGGQRAPEPDGCSVGTGTSAMAPWLGIALLALVGARPRRPRSRARPLGPLDPHR